MLMQVTKEHYDYAKRTVLENPQCRHIEHCVMSVAFMDLLKTLEIPFFSVSYEGEDEFDVFQLKEGVNLENLPTDEYNLRNSTKRVGTAYTTSTSEKIAEKFDVATKYCCSSTTDEVAKAAEDKLLAKLPIKVKVTLDDDLKRLRGTAQKEDNTNVGN